MVVFFVGKTGNAGSHSNGSKPRRIREVSRGGACTDLCTTVVETLGNGPDPQRSSTSRVRCHIISVKTILLVDRHEGLCEVMG